MGKKITFPHVGHLGIALEAFLWELGCEPVPPPENSQKTLSLGIFYGPEEACLPLHVTLGNLIQGAEAGGECGVMIGGGGPCRLGYYSAVQRKVLKREAPDLELFVFEPKMKSVINRCRTLFGSIPLTSYVRAFYLLWQKLLVMDSFEEIFLRLGGRVLEREKALRIGERFYKNIRNASSYKGIKETFYEASQALYSLPKKDETPIIRIGLLGDVYMLCETGFKGNIVHLLHEGGAEVQKSIYLSTWIYEHVIRRKRNKRVLEAAKKYLPSFIGGHGQESVGQALLWMDEGVHGLLHLFPFTCTPEIIAEQALKKHRDSHPFPILSLVYHGQTGEEGIRTRVEAFLDMARWRNLQFFDKGSPMC